MSSPKFRHAKSMLHPQHGLSALVNYYGQTSSYTCRMNEETSPPFRFYDNRQKYLAFVTTCNEKSAIAHRATHEVTLLRPTPPAVRIFDAGMGDGTVITRVMRATHWLFSTIPQFVVAKEISLEDVRLGLEKLPDRLFEHPSTVFVVTNLNYAEAPRLMQRDAQAAAALNWQAR